MKDEHDKYTADLSEEPPHVPQRRGAVANQRKPFQVFRAKQDEQSTFAPRPKCARLGKSPSRTSSRWGHAAPV